MRSAQHPWGLRAILATVAGFAISLLVTIVTVSGQAMGIPFLKALERAGGDAGMQLAWSFELDKSLSQGPPYIFVDVDPGACGKLRHDGSATAEQACQTDRSVSAALVADFLRAAAGSEARVVILDVAPFESPEDVQTVRSAVHQWAGPYILAPLAGRPGMDGDQPIFIRRGEADLAPSGRMGRLRQVSFQATTDPAADDGVVRGYGLTIETRFGGQARLTPSAPWMAALLLHDKTQSAADCLYFATDCARATEAGRAELRRVNDPAFRAPIVFSLPSLAVPAARRMAAGDDPDPAETRQDRRWSLNADWFAANGYERLVASEVLSDGNGHFPREIFKSGALVVLGSSAPGAMDLHPTPIGTMAGSEIVINATRALSSRIGRTVRQPTFLDMALEKIGAAFQGSAVMLCIWLIIFGLASRLGSGVGLGWRLAGRVLIVFVFIAGMAATAYQELLGAADDLAVSLPSGRPVDILTPIVALGVDGYAEAVKHLSRTIEGGTLRAGRFLLSLFTRAPAAKQQDQIDA